MEVRTQLFFGKNFFVGLITFVAIVIIVAIGIFQYIEYQADAAQKAIDTTAFATGSSHFQSGGQSVFINDLTGYKFYRDLAGYCVYRKTVDGGNTWSATTSVDAQLDCIQIQVWYDKWTPGGLASSSIHIATLDTGSSDVWYNRLDTTNDQLLLSSTTVVSVSTGQAGSVTLLQNTISITRGTDGTIYISYIDNGDSFVQECTVNCGVAGSWTETGTRPFGLDNNFAMLVPLTGGNIMAIHRNIGTEDMGSKVWNNGAGAWDAATTTFDISATDNTAYIVGMSAVVSTTTPGTVYLAYIASSTVLGTDDEIRTAKYRSGTWTTTSDVITATTRGLTNVAIGLDANNDDVYVAYTGRTTAGTPNTGNVYWKWATSSMLNWSTEVGSISTAGDLYGVDLNRASDERLFASWFSVTLGDVLGDIILDTYSGIHATATSKQVPFLEASSTNQYVGGAFVFTENYKSHDVTGITITENGTIDASTYLKNVTLKYEMDDTIPYDCASVSYDGSETQFGATSTAGFSSANGSSSFSGTTVTVSTTTALCVYPVMDILFLATTTPTTTLDIYINNPVTDVVVTGSTAGPTTTIAIASTTIVYNTNPTQTGYHWRQDNGTEATAISATGAENTPFTKVKQLSPYRLRIQVSNEGGTTTTNYQYRLEYVRKTSTCSAATGWTDVGDALGDWDMTGSQLTEAGNTTNIGATATGSITDANPGFVTSNGGQRETTSQTGNITSTSTQFVELEYAVQATASSTEGWDYCFRVTNAGTPLPTYLQYGEATVNYPNDFRVQRGVSTILVANTSVTITAGTDYIAPSASTSAFIRITNTLQTGAGDTTGVATNQLSDDVTVYITDPSNITSSVTFARVGAVNDTRVAWEIIEYTGVAGGENEMIVRQQGPQTYGATSFTATTSAVSGVVTDADVAVFITGQGNPDGGRTNYNAGLSTASWNSGADTASFRRGEAAGAVITSYAVVEYTGSNWVVQRSPEHTYSAVGTTETETIASVYSTSQAFIHTQKRVGLNLNTHANFGHEVWLTGLNQISFRLDPAATTPGGHVSVAWVIENTQLVGEKMVVSRTNGTSTGGTSPRTENVTFTPALTDLSIASIFLNNRGSGAVNTFPEPIMNVRLISLTQYELWVSNVGNNRVYQTEIVEWPTARRKITQNYYQIYRDNDVIDPTEQWPGELGPLGENEEVRGLDNPIISGSSTRIRMTLEVSAAAMIPGVDAFKLQYAPRVTTCSAISNANWLNLGAVGSTTAIWRGINTSVTDGTALSTDPPTAGDLNLSVSTPFGVAGTFEEENDTALTPYQVNAGENVEFDWAVEDNGATDKTSYCFRMVEDDGTELEAYNFYPTIRTIGYGAQSQAWRWYDDAQSETPTSTLAATNTAPIDIDYDNSIKLRMTLREVNGANGTNLKFKLQFSEYADFSTSTDVAEIGDCTNLSYWCYANGGGVDNATITTRTLGDAGPCASQTGVGCGTHNESGTTTSTFIHTAGSATEFSFTIRNSGARTNRVYYFRAYDVTHDEVVVASTTYPSLVTKGASLVFGMESVSAGTVIGDVTLDVTTTPATISFGALPLNTSVEGAHRLSIDTNGTEGYKIVMTMTSDMLNAYGGRVEPVLGTNASLLSWSAGCVALAGSCLGYHSTDATLQGGSTRFSAPDTYARFSTTTYEEVAYSSQPALTETTDIVFRILVRQLQAAGQYTSTIRYISIPVF